MMEFIWHEVFTLHDCLAFYGSVVCVCLCVFGFDMRWKIFVGSTVSPTHTWHGVLRACPGFYVCVRLALTVIMFTQGSV